MFFFPPCSDFYFKPTLLEAINKHHPKGPYNIPRREALIAMRALGIDVIAMLETPQLIFGETPSLSFADFTETILALRDTNTATVGGFGKATVLLETNRDY